MLGLTEQLDTYSPVSTVLRYRVVINKVVFISQRKWEHCQKVQKQERKTIIKENRCRNGMPKSAQTKKDKSDGKYTKPHSYIFALLWKDVGMDEALYIYHHFYPSLFVYFLARHSYFIFNDFSFLYIQCSKAREANFWNSSNYIVKSSYHSIFT